MNIVQGNEVLHNTILLSENANFVLICGPKEQLPAKRYFFIIDNIVIYNQQVKAGGTDLLPDDSEVDKQSRAIFWQGLLWSGAYAILRQDSGAQPW